MGKVPNCECLFVHRKRKFFLSVYVDDIKMAGTNQNLAPVWQKMMKDVDIEEPTLFLDHVYLGCTQRECPPNEKIIGQCNKMFESRISAEATDKLPGWDKLRAKTSAWFYDMEGHARKCVERYCELANKKNTTTIQGFQSLFLTITTKFKRKSWKTKVTCWKFAPILYLNACTWHELTDLSFCGQSTN